MKIPFIKKIRETFSGKKKVAGVTESPEIEAQIHELLLRLKSHHKETYHHSRRVANYSVLMAKRLGITDSELSDLYYGAILHDIGKLEVPQTILNKKRTFRDLLSDIRQLEIWEEILTNERPPRKIVKESLREAVEKPAPLTDAEIASIKSHPVEGYLILKEAQLPEAIAEIALYHHKIKNNYPTNRTLAGLEKEDYPTIEELLERGEEEGYRPLISEIVATADTFDAITGQRNYRKQRSKEEALRIIQAGKGTLFDPYCVEALEDVLDSNKDLVESLQLYSLTESLEFFSQS